MTQRASKKRSIELRAFADILRDTGRYGVDFADVERASLLSDAANDLDRQRAEVERLTWERDEWKAQAVKWESSDRQRMAERDRLRAALLNHVCNCGPTDPDPSVHREDCAYRLALSGEHSAPETAAPQRLELTRELRWILGRPCFTLIGIAESLRRMGRSVEPRAEDEQAVSIHWMLSLYLEHGADKWRDEAEKILKEWSQRPPLKAEREAAPLPDRLAILGYAPGNYSIECIDCHAFKIADKRALRCYECAMKRDAQNGSECQEGER